MGTVTQLVLAIISKDSRIPLERWVFDINLVEQPAEGSQPYGPDRKTATSIVLTVSFAGHLPSPKLRSRRKSVPS